MSKRRFNPDTFGFLVNDIARLFRAEIDQRITQAGLEMTPAEARTLVHVARHEPVRQSVLAERMGIEAMTLSAYLDRLEKRELITRITDPDDRRAKQVQLTHAAEAVLVAINKITCAVRKRAAMSLPEAEWHLLNQQLKTVRDNLAATQLTSNGNG